MLRIALVFKRETGVGPATSTLARWRSTTELFPQIILCVFRRCKLRYSSGKRELDPRHPPWQGGALPLSYSRKFCMSQHLRHRNCERRDLNPYAVKAPEPKSGVSAVSPLSHKECVPSRLTQGLSHAGFEPTTHRLRVCCSTS